MASQHQYVAGQMLPLQIDDHHVDANIISVFEPFTLSCAMVAELDSSRYKGSFVLKLYDRRFAVQLRRDEDVPLWDTRIEAGYQELVRTGKATEFFSTCTANFLEDEFWANERDAEWNEAQQEAYLQWFCLKTYNTEKDAYEKLHDIQGNSVPRIFAQPYIQAVPGSCPAHEFLDCPGLLMQHIQGFPLNDLADNAPREDWQYICEEAIRIVHMIGDRGICNKDVKTRSFIIRQDVDTRKYQAFMTDFGHCAFRSQAKDDREFRSWQADQDEEGAVGAVMEKLLEGGFKWHLSPRAMELLDEFESEESSD